MSSSVTTKSPTLVEPPATSPTKSAHQCLQCTPVVKKESRNLIVCIDGTSNQFGRNDTNIVKLAAKIDLESPRVKQYTYYSSGIGTRPSTNNWFSRIKSAVVDKFDMMIAWNVTENVQDAYYWLAEMYKEGDRIYLFGFSRGAYQVRVLAGMIDEVGLLKTMTEKQIGMAYDHYAAIPLRKPHAKQSAMRFKKTFCHEGIRVHFLGVWDTVSSVGLTRGTVFPFSDHACHVRHALALDERRVKFIPEYFKKMNVEPGDEKSKRAQRESTASSNEVNSSDEKKDPTDIKEVWFAGSHSDVGGRSKPGSPFQAGNASLLWMRREAAEHGLVLKPTDAVWVPDDIDFGTSNPMGLIWRAVEYLPIKHQVMFSGDGKDARRLHRREPRCIIPGQKVHASILHAKSYKPQASLGRGFHIPIARDAVDTKLNWEEALFDETAAEDLVGRMENQYGVAPIYLDKLLFMLQFKEGKQCVRNVPDWQGRFKSLIKSDCESLVKLVAITALYEASLNDDTHPESDPPSRYKITPPKLLQVFNNAKDRFRGVLDAYKHEDGPTVFTLLQPFTKHQDLRDNILTLDVLKPLVDLFDQVCSQKGKNFGQAMVGLDCLLRCECIRDIVIKKLGEPFPGSSTLRLQQILKVNDKQLLIPALRMVMTLARIAKSERADSPPQDANSTQKDASSTAITICDEVKSRIRKLAGSHKGLIGLLSMEILLILYDPKTNDGHVRIHNRYVRANLCNALVCSGPTEGKQSTSNKHKLSEIFQPGTGDAKQTKVQSKLFKELIKAVLMGKTEERTAATKALLELWRCEFSVHQSIPDGLRVRLLNKILSILVNQLRKKEKALLAAYALAQCLNYNDVKVKEALKGNKAFAKNIVGMLWHDYFDDAVGSVEGFQILKDLMQNEDLRKNIEKYDLSELLRKKLVKGNARETRTSLIYLSVLLSHDKDGPWTSELVQDGLVYLEKSKWNDRKAGVAILSALAQTEHGVATISLEIDKIIGMLLPSTSKGSGGVLRRCRAFLGLTVTDLALGDPTAKSPYLLLGPVHALCKLAQNGVLRDRMCKEKQYVTLKQLYLSEMLVDKRHWYLPALVTPRRTDVVDTLDNLMKALDEHKARGQSSRNTVLLACLTTLMFLLNGVMTMAILSAPASSSAILTALTWIYNIMKLPLAGYPDGEPGGLHKERKIGGTQVNPKEDGVSREGSDVSEVTVCDRDVPAGKTTKVLAI